MLLQQKGKENEYKIDGCDERRAHTLKKWHVIIFHAIWAIWLIPYLGGMIMGML